MKGLAQRILTRLKIKKDKKNFYTKEVFRHYKNFEIGEYTYGEPTVLFPKGARLIIGKYCSIAQNVKIFLGGNHKIDWITTYPFSSIEDFKSEASHITGHPATKGDVIIGNDVWIGRDTTILSGINIADGAVIGAGSVVTKNVGAYEVWGGNPAKLIKKRFSEDDIKKLEMLRWWDKSDNDIRKLIPYLCSEDLNKLFEICSKD